MIRARLLAVAVVLAVFLALFHGLIFGAKNLAFRDAGHFYYPYYLHVQQEWRAGRVPLWSNGENGGVPLAANPTSCVFYPPKLIFALLSYPQAFKWYHLGHLLLAAYATYFTASRFGASPLAAAFGGLAYAFGGFVLFQIYNIVFLVGAAWLPLGLLAVDRVVRLGSRMAVIGLAVIFALQTLGGDPQVAYLTGVIAGFYALLYHLKLRLGLLAIVGSLSLGALAVHRRGLVLLWKYLLTSRVEAKTPQLVECICLGCVAVSATIAALVLGTYAWRNRKRENRQIQLPVLQFRLLAVSALFAGSFAAVQLLPTYEFVQFTDRAAPDAPHESAGFSFFPLRIVEWLAPSFFGRTYTVDSRWFPYDSIETGVWIPDLYMGLPTILMAFAAMSLFRGSPVLRLLTWVVLLSVWASFGKFALGRFVEDDSIIGLAFMGKESNPVLQAGQGNATLTLYGRVSGPYWLMEQCLPGFRSFRYPSKLLVFSALGIALLSAAGLDRLRNSLTKKMATAFAVLALAAGVGAVGVWLFGAAFESRFAESHSRGSFGPMDISAARWRLTFSFIHAFAVSVAAWGVVMYARRQLQLSGNFVPAAFLVLLGLDLAVAQRWMVLVDDQAIIDAVPKVVSVIRQEEAKEVDPQPFRVHRTRQYHPPNWSLVSSPTRYLEMSRWERETIQPKYALPYGFDYTVTVGTMSIYDVEFFFAPWNVLTPPDLRALLRTKPERITYFPRVGYNMWNTKYFVLPKFNKPDDEDRGNYTLLSTREGAPCPVLAESDAMKDDYVVLKNPECMPRARLVHLADLRNPLRTLDRDERRPAMEELVSRHLDAGQQLWRNPKYPEYPHDRMAMIETDQPQKLAPYLSAAPPDPSESVRFEVYESNRVRLKVRANSPGLVVLADTFYPGWTATVDGKPAEIFRANRVMRAVGVPSGDHIIEMSYRCVWFEMGAFISSTAWLAVGVVLFRLRGGTNSTAPSPSI